MKGSPTPNAANCSRERPGTDLSALGMENSPDLEVHLECKGPSPRTPPNNRGAAGTLSRSEELASTMVYNPHPPQVQMGAGSGCHS